jgi:hypothetical protein
MEEGDSRPRLDSELLALSFARQKMSVFLVQVVGIVSQRFSLNAQGF